MPLSAKALPVAIRTRGVAADRGALRSLLRHCLDSAGVAAGTGVGVILAGDRLVSRLNRQWRGKDGSTDVLSFPAGGLPPLPPGAAETVPRLLGEIVISVPRCRQQAAVRGIDPGVELVRLLVHGVLHLLGHEHQNAPARRSMQARERAWNRWAAAADIGPGILLARRPSASRRRSQRPRSEGRSGSGRRVR